MEPDDPDANFYEHYACGSPRHTRVLRPQITDSSSSSHRNWIAASDWRSCTRSSASWRTPPSARSSVWRLDYFAMWPYVRNLVPHHSLYGWGRLQDVWLDK